MKFEVEDGVDLSKVKELRFAFKGRAIAATSRAGSDFLKIIP